MKTTRQIASRQRRNTAATTATTSGTNSSPTSWNSHIGRSRASGRPLIPWNTARSHPGTSPVDATAAQARNTTMRSDELPTIEGPAVVGDHRRAMMALVSAADDHPHAHEEGQRGHRGHDHGAAARRAGARHQRPLRLAFVLILGFLLVQAIVGLWTGSLALLSDAGHMATDALGLGMALAAIHAASRAGANPQRTFGLYRLEILAALANAVLLFGVAAYVLYEAVVRLGEDREIDSAPVLIVGLLGLAVNVVAFLRAP